MQETVQLFTAPNGQLSAKAFLPDGTPRHLHSLVDPSIEGAFYKSLDWWGDVIVFAGLGLGYHIAPRAPQLPAKALLVAVDYYDACIDHCRKAVFSGLENRAVFISRATEQNKETAVGLVGQNPVPKIQVVKHPASFSLHQEFYETILDALMSRTNGAHAITNPAARASTIDKALLMHGNFFLEQEIAGALHANGIATGLFPYNDVSSPSLYENTLMRRLQEERPVAIVSVNMKGIDPDGVFESVTRRLGIPVFIWFVDDPRRIVPKRLSPPLVAPYTNFIAACWEKAYIPWLEQAGFSKVVYLPLATDPAIFHSVLPASPSVELGFVGTSMVDAYAGKIKEKFLWSESLAPLVEQASEKLLACPEYDVDGDLADFARRLSIPLQFSDIKNMSWLCALIIHTAGMKKRTMIVGGLMSEGIETFGDAAGWKQVLGPSIKTNPDVDYRRGLREVYRRICINVNSTSCQMPSAVNQRVFDIPASGSFVLSDNQKDLRDLFDIGKEAVVYENLADLKDKIRFYASHEEQRKRIIAAAQKRISGEHTYAKRIRDIVGMI
jgi:spore maturation protein CgeB